MPQTASKKGVLDGVHILVVEDDFDGREILHFRLTYFGGRVTAVANALQALNLLNHIEPDIVITDIVMKGAKQDGLWLLRAARKQGSAVPYIAVSGQHFEERYLKHSGFAAYMRKPLDHERLVRTILTALNQKR
jgi:CheY-like chemotaxis protein